MLTLGTMMAIVDESCLLLDIWCLFESTLNTSLALSQSSQAHTEKEVINCTLLIRKLRFKGVHSKPQLAQLVSAKIQP